MSQRFEEGINIGENLSNSNNINCLRNVFQKSILNFVKMRLGKDLNDEAEDPHNLLESATKYECNEISRFAGHQIIANYSTQFDANCTGTITGYPSSENPFKIHDGHHLHSYICTKVLDDELYYAMSPANLNFSDQEPKISIIVGKDMTEITNKISQLEGGEWHDLEIMPSDKSVKTNIENSNGFRVIRVARITEPELSSQSMQLFEETENILKNLEMNIL